MGSGTGSVLWLSTGSQDANPSGLHCRCDLTTLTARSTSLENEYYFVTTAYQHAGSVSSLSAAASTTASCAGNSDIPPTAYGRSITRSGLPLHWISNNDQFP